MCFNFMIKMYLLNTLGFHRTCSGGAYAYVPETISQEVLRIDTEPQPGQYLVEDKWAKIASKDPIKVKLVPQMSIIYTTVGREH